MVHHAACLLKRAAMPPRRRRTLAPGKQAVLLPPGTCVNPVLSRNKPEYPICGIENSISSTDKFVSEVDRHVEPARASGPVNYSFGAPLRVFVSFGVMCLLNTGVLARTASAQETQSPVISTERPTVGSSPDLIPRRSLQVENGAGVTFQRHQYVADFPEALLRFGLTNKAEIRWLFGDEVYQRSSGPDSHSLQTMDPNLSVKLALGKPNSLYPRSAVLGLSFPRGGSSWTSGSYDPGVAAIWTQTIKKAYFLNELAGSTLTTLAGSRRMSWTPSIAGGRSLSQIVTAFAEYAPTVLEDSRLQYVVDGGFGLTLRRLSQLDIRTGYLRDSAGLHALFSVGYSVRRDEVSSLCLTCSNNRDSSSSGQAT